MSEQEKANEQQGHSELSQVYSALARETVPPELDRKILGIAEANKSQGLRKWSRPIAIAATITICFSLLLQLADEPQEPQFQSRGARSVMPEKSTPNLPAAVPSDKPGERAALPQLSEETAMPVPADAATGEMSMMEKTTTISDEAMPQTALDSGLSSSRCPAVSRENPESWWQCIAGLRAEGREEEAQAEQHLLDLAFPDFVPTK